MDMFLNSPCGFVLSGFFGEFLGYLFRANHLAYTAPPQPSQEPGPESDSSINEAVEPRDISPADLQEAADTTFVGGQTEDPMTVESDEGSYALDLELSCHGWRMVMVEDTSDPKSRALVTTCDMFFRYGYTQSTTQVCRRTECASLTRHNR